MSEPLAPTPALPGLESAGAGTLRPAAPAGCAARLRVQPVDRSQQVWRTVEVEHQSVALRLQPRDRRGARNGPALHV